MLCLGPKKSLLSPRLELIAQDMAQGTDDKSQVWNHSGTPQLTKGCKTLASAWLLHDTVERLNAGDLNAFAWGEDHNENHKGWSGLKTLSGHLIVSSIRALLLRFCSVHFV